MMKQKIIPPSLLSKPLPPEKVQLMTDEEKRQYNIQKAKYDGALR
jgi:hypothetical protein